MSETSNRVSIEDWFESLKKEVEKDGYSSKPMDMKDWIIYYKNGYSPKQAYEEYMCPGI